MRHQRTDNRTAEHEPADTLAGADLEVSLIFESVRNDRAHDEPRSRTEQGAAKKAAATLRLVVEEVVRDSEWFVPGVRDWPGQMEWLKSPWALGPLRLGGNRVRAQEQQAQGPASPQRRVNGISPRIG